MNNKKTILIIILCVLSIFFNALTSGICIHYFLSTLFSLIIAIKDTKHKI